MAEPTIMVLTVDLGCNRCYRKVKKLLCKFPEIRDQVFYEKEDTVIIKVVCCSPERIRSKLICKGGKTIKRIEIKVPEKPKPPPDKLKDTEKPKAKPDKNVKVTQSAEKSEPSSCKSQPPRGKLKMADNPDHNTEKKQSADPDTRPPPGPTPLLGGGPCHHGYGIPYRLPSYDGYVRLVPSYDGPYGNWASGSCRCNRCYECRCEYFTEENPTCTIL